MRAGRGEVDAQLRDLLFLVSEAVHGIQDDENPLVLPAIGIDLRHGPRERAHRNLHAAARVHPGEADDARVRTDRALQTIDHFVGGCLGRIHVERNAPPAGAGLLDREANRLVMHVVVVCRAEHFIARLERQPLVDEGEPLGRAVRERHFLGATADVACGSVLYADRERVLFRILPEERVEAHAVLDRRKGLGIEHAAKALNRIAHRLRVRDDVELRKMHPVGREIELGAYRGPVRAAVDRGNGDGLVRRGSARGGSGHERQTDGCNEVTAIQHDGVLSPEERSTTGCDTALLRKA